MAIATLFELRDTDACVRAEGAMFSDGVAVVRVRDFGHNVPMTTAFASMKHVRRAYEGCRVYWKDNGPHSFVADDVPSDQGLDFSEIAS